MNIYLLKWLSRYNDYKIKSNEDNSDLAESVEIITNIAYSNIDRKYKKLDIHYPKKTMKKMPILIFFHGGGLFSGDKRMFLRFCSLVAKEGYLVFNINYRLGPRYLFPAQLFDCIEAINWIKKNVENFNGDIDKTFIGGASSGAQLASLLTSVCTDETFAARYKVGRPLKPEQLKGALFYYGVYNVKAMASTKDSVVKAVIKATIGVADLDKYEDIDKLSPVANINKAYPPVFITAGELDFLYKQTLDMIKEFDDKGIQYESLLFDKSNTDAVHAYLNNLSCNSSQKSIAATFHFLGKYR